MAKGPGRPKGARNKATVQVRELARQHAKRAIGALLDITDDKEAPHAARVSAANSLLDRGFGKPKQETELSGGLHFEKIVREIVEP
tara:strand:+ start:1691 stop:1948 length:258 start_codon:yes stop_codon:yes gene_type:complete